MLASAILGSVTPVAAQWCPAAGPELRPAVLRHHARLGRPDEPGAPLELRGTVRTPDGRPAPGTIIYAYHTDPSGRYRPGTDPVGLERLHGRLRGWVQADSQGRWGFRTVRPAPYPGLREPAHIHLEVLPPDAGSVACEIDPVQFTDDPLLTPALRRAQPGYGGPGAVTPVRDAGGMWHAVRDITLWSPDHVDTMVVDVEASVVGWRGTKFNGRGSHAGTVRLSPGLVVLGGPPMVQGTLVFPLRTIAVTDIPAWEPIPRGRLTRHLQSAHFFDVARYPEARLVLQRARRVSPGTVQVEGLLTIRDRTHPITFPATFEPPPEASIAATARFRINRHTWGLDYRGSTLGNDLVDDDITFSVRLVARRRR